mmetsp:Transcript_9497/g.22946  ORF Transcript_9497/g.22946 Transcript_9497/m.22946 type:complete len:331 (-) Transcript_9497:35-1027(-)
MSMGICLPPTWTVRSGIVKQASCSSSMRNRRPSTSMSSCRFSFLIFFSARALITSPRARTTSDTPAHRVPCEIRACTSLREVLPLCCPGDSVDASPSLVASASSKLAVGTWLTCSNAPLSRCHVRSFALWYSLVFCDCSSRLMHCFCFTRSSAACSTSVLLSMIFSVAISVKTSFTLSRLTPMSSASVVPSLSCCSTRVLDCSSSTSRRTRSVISVPGSCTTCPLPYVTSMLRRRTLSTYTRSSRASPRYSDAAVASSSCFASSPTSSAIGDSRPSSTPIVSFASLYSLVCTGDASISSASLSASSTSPSSRRAVLNTSFASMGVEHIWR